MDAIQEVRVEREAEFGKCAELGGVSGIARGEDSCGGGGGFGEGDGLVKHGDADAAVLEFDGEGEDDDAGAGDADVGVVHEISLVGCGEVIVLVYQFCGPRSGRWSARRLCGNE